MLSHSVYSVISPEGCASILWRDASFSPQAAEALKPTAQSLLALKVIDEIIPEPLGGAHRNYEQTSQEIRRVLLKHLKRLSVFSTSKLLKQRFEKYSAMGLFSD
jgi:acetyl-CoA carboxylase carboxyl transferase subunit alpha